MVITCLTDHLHKSAKGGKSCTAVHSCNDITKMKKKVKKIKKPDSGKSKSVFKDKDFHFCLSRCHKIDPCNYYIYQTPHTIKIHVIIPGIENVPKSKIKIKFKDTYFELSIFDYVSSNYHLQFGQLAYQIIPSLCKYFIRKDKIIIEIAKEIPRVWRAIGDGIQKGYWLAKFSTFLEDIPELTFIGGYGDSLWDELIKLKDIDFDFLKPPIKMHRYIPALKDHPPFKSLEEALRFYKNRLRKDYFNEALFVLFGFTLMKKMKVDNYFKNPDNPESIEESLFMSRKFLQKCQKNGNMDDEHLVECLKMEGNSYYKIGKFYAALQMYLEALKLSPNNFSLLANASAAYMMLGLYHDALNIAQKAVQADNSFKKGYQRIGKCNLALGNPKAALKAFTKANELGQSKDVDTEIMKVHKLQDYIKEGKIASDCGECFLAEDLYTNAHLIARANTSILLLLCEFKIRCRSQSYVENKAKSRMEQNPNDPYAFLMLGMIDYYKDNKEGAMTRLNKAVKSGKNDTQIISFMKRASDLYKKRASGDEAFKKKNYEEALKHYKEALRTDPGNLQVNGKIHFNMSTIYMHQNKIDEAIQSLTDTMKCKGYDEKTCLKRAGLYMKKKKYYRAVQDWKQINLHNPSDYSKKRLEEAEFMMNKKNRKSLYKVLNVSSSASPEELKKAYYKLARCHPLENTEELEAHTFCQKSYKEVVEAYNTLKDPVKREKYDNDKSIYLDEDDEDDYDDDDEEDEDDDYDDSGEEEDLEFTQFLFAQFMEDRIANVSCLLDDDDFSDDYDELSDDDDDDDDEDDDDDYDDECYCLNVADHLKKQRFK